MRACAAVNALFGTVSCALALVAACTGGSPPPQQPASTEGATATNETPTGPATPAPTGDSAAATGGGKAPRTPADCKAKLSEITNEPPSGGVATNNAMTSADAGSSDRFDPLVDLVKSKREAFRCCFDIHAQKNPGVHGRVVMVFEIKPDGTLIKADVDQGASGLHAPDVSSCMIDVAKSMTYPKSPSGKETKFTYPFDFKAKN